jgi:hypothetical protein
MNNGTSSITPKKVNNVFWEKRSNINPALQYLSQESSVKRTPVCAILPSIVELHLVLLFDSRGSEICVKFGQATVKKCQDNGAQLA